MTMALILITDPARRPLDGRTVERLGRGTRLRWLAAEEAVELLVDDDRAPALERTAREMLDGQAVDVALLPAGGRRKRLLVADMDSTMITVECIDELADFVGCRSEIEAITRRAMNGELDFKAALEARVALLAGLSADVLEQVWRERVRLMPGAATLVSTMRAHGAHTVLVSGGFFPIVERVRAALGFHLAEANRLEARDGRLTGRVLEPVKDAGSKLRVLEATAAALGFPLAATLAVGDGANDLPMLQAAGLGVAFHAHPRVAGAARVRLDATDLTGVLYLQGFTRAQFSHLAGPA